MQHYWAVLGVLGAREGSRFGRKGDILLLDFGDGGSAWRYMRAEPLVAQVCVRRALFQKG